MTCAKRSILCWMATSPGIPSQTPVRICTGAHTKGASHDQTNTSSHQRTVYSNYPAAWASFAGCSPLVKRHGCPSLAVMSEVMTDYSLTVITVTSPLQRAQKILAREQIGAHGRNRRTSSTTPSHETFCSRSCRTSRQFSSVSVGPRRRFAQAHG